MDKIISLKQREEIQARWYKDPTLISTSEKVAKQAFLDMNLLLSNEQELRKENEKMRYCLDNIANRPIGVFGEEFGYDFHYENLRKSAKKCLSSLSQAIGAEYAEGEESRNKECTHKDKNGEFTVIIDGELERCTQCGLVGK